MGEPKKWKFYLKKMLPTMVGRRRKIWFLEDIKTAHRRLKIDTTVKILVRYCLHFLKNTKKLTKKLIKIFFSKFLKFVWTLLFSISRSFEYFYQRKIIHNIGVCVQNWQRVISFLTHFWSKPSLIKPSHVGNLCLLLH